MPKDLIVPFSVVMAFATDESFRATEAQRDNQLIEAVKATMMVSLRNARDAGRHGWWDKDACSIDDLRGYREKALEGNDHVSVINFTAMIATRETEEI